MLSVNVYTYISFISFDLSESCGQSALAFPVLSAVNHICSADGERDAHCIFIPPVNKANNHAKPATMVKDCVHVATARFRPNLRPSVAILVLMKTNILSRNVIFS